jgi:hypothetical protein
MHAYKRRIFTPIFFLSFDSVHLYILSIGFIEKVSLCLLLICMLIIFLPGNNVAIIDGRY